MRCFTVLTKEIDFRIDPDYYLPEIFGLLRELKKSPYKLETLDDISQRVVDGPFGSAIKSEDYVEVGIPFIRVADVTKGNGTIRTNDMVFISKDAHKRIKRSKVSPGDVVIAKTGATMGAASIVPKTIEDGNIRGDLAAITLDNEVVAQYLVNFINTTIGQKLFWRLNSGATRGRVVIGNLKKLQVIVPPEKIMVRINEILETAQSIKKQKETEAQRLLDSIDDYVLSELGIELPEFEHKMCFSVRASEVEGKRSDPSCFHPIHVKTVSAISSVQSTSLAKAVKFRRELVSEISEKDIYVGLENILSNDGKYVKRDIKSNISSAFRFKKGDVLFPKLRPYLNKVSYAQFNGICSTEFHVLKAELCDPFFLFLFLRNKAVLEQTSRLMTGNTLPRLQTDDVKNLIVPTPDLNIQQKLVNHCQNIYLKREKLLDEAGVILQTAKAQVEKIILGEKI